MTITRTIATTDYHTAGEPFRIVHERPPTPAGRTVADRRVSAIGNDDDADDVRRLLCQEPRGHADMYGGFLVPPDDDGAHFGVLFWHKDGFSTACGHGTIALGVWATETGRVESDPDGITEVRIDVPSGRVAALVERRDGALVRATFRNVPSHVLARGLTVETSRGRVPVDLAFSGAVYASVRAADAGLAVEPRFYTDLIATGREITRALAGSADTRHDADPRLSGVYGTIFWDDLGRGESGPIQRNATVFADGQVDRSPCGSGTGARVALLADDRSLRAQETLTHRSLVGTEFHAGWTPAASEDPRSVIPHVSGTAYRTGEHRFVLDPHDPLGAGFVLR